MKTLTTLILIIIFTGCGGDSNGPDKIHKWETKKINYMIEPDMSDDIIELFYDMIEDIEKRSDYRFTEVFEDKEYTLMLMYNNESKTARSTVGKVSSPYISISRDFKITKYFIGVLYHEMFHVLGGRHEQQREDRNEYIEVVWENLLNSGKPEYEIVSMPYDITKYRYDLKSIMHYSPTQYSSNGKKVFKIKQNGQTDWKKLKPTALDWSKLNSM